MAFLIGLDFEEGDISYDVIGRLLPVVRSAISGAGTL